VTPSEAHKINEELLHLAHVAGTSSDMAILGEGNVSARLDDQRFLIKASGTNLASLTEQQLVEVNTRTILAALEGGKASDEEIESLLLASRVDPTALKPSVETLFHAWLLELPGVDFIGHTHPICVNQLLCSPRAREFAQARLFPDHIVYCGAESVLIPYVDPGMILSRRIADEVTKFVNRTGTIPRNILLENHGLIALGGTARQVEAGLLMAEKAAKLFVGAVTVGGPQFMPKSEVDRIAGRIDEHYRQRMMESSSPN